MPAAPRAAPRCAARRRDPGASGTTATTASATPSFSATGTPTPRTLKIGPRAARRAVVSAASGPVQPGGKRQLGILSEMSRGRRRRSASGVRETTCRPRETGRRPAARATRLAQTARDPAAAGTSRRGRLGGPRPARVELGSVGKPFLARRPLVGEQHVFVGSERHERRTTLRAKRP